MTPPDPSVGLQQDRWPFKWLSLPTWLIMVCLGTRFYPTDHPWRKRPRFTLEVWWSGQTPACRDFDIGLWAGVIFFIMVITEAIKRWTIS